MGSTPVVPGSSGSTVGRRGSSRPRASSVIARSTLSYLRERTVLHLGNISRSFRRVRIARRPTVRRPTIAVRPSGRSTRRQRSSRSRRRSRIGSGASRGRSARTRVRIGSPSELGGRRTAIGILRVRVPRVSGSGRSRRRRQSRSCALLPLALVAGGALDLREQGRRVDASAVVVTFVGQEILAVVFLERVSAA